MKTANDTVLKALGALLIVAGALKGWQLLREPVDTVVRYTEMMKTVEGKIAEYNVVK